MCEGKNVGKNAQSMLKIETVLWRLQQREREKKTCDGSDNICLEEDCSDDNAIILIFHYFCTSLYDWNQILSCDSEVGKTMVYRLLLILKTFIFVNIEDSQLKINRK